ncbi:solute carrier family 12 domain-containing protein [Ditylenchus destructor]|uniref:Solute carrier family 12 domain-containing protein n=1 Tax=Ditylenchus destructor TaxID=166010 RepID=A0AAD4MZV1_9BILA|nr:solute carrier family 12 domain-containing protein [Ditylenchus destructor]
MNLLPNFRDGESFISVFAVFFPGFTGMLAGTMYIDQLRNPATDVAMGLFTSIATTSGMYLVAVVACGATMLRDASGIEEPFINNVTGLWNTPECASTESCRYGLMNYYQVAEITSAWRPLIIIGMFGMTISSTMTNLDQGPQNFQAACKDAIFPYMKYFGKEYGKNNFPRRAYILLAFFTIALSLIGDLNALNEIVTNMFMATYALVNYACFDASFVRSPGWRPHFEYYNMWVSLFGATICVIIMFVVSVGSSIVISLIFAACLAYFHYSHPDVNWGDTHQAHVYRSALGNLMKLTSSEEHVKNFRPQILLLSGNPASRVPLLDFAHSITKGDSLLVCGHVVQYPPSSRLFTVMNRLQNEMERWLRKNKIKAFYQNLANEKLRYGTMNMFELSGLGKLRPNVVLLGFKTNWIRGGVENIQEIEDYVGILRDAFENNYGVAIMRDNGRGFDLSEEFLNLGIKDIDALKKSFASVPMELDELDKGANAFERVNSQLKENFGINVRTMNIISKINPQATIQGSDNKRSKFFSDRHLFEVFGDEEEEDAEDFEGEYDTIIGQNTLTNAGTIQSRTVQSHQRSTERELRRSRSENFGMSKQIQMKLEKEFAATEALAKHMNAFHKKRKGGKVRIDVWWLYDDGGLTLLIPHLLRLPKSYLEGAELRVLTLTGSEDEVNEESMIALLGKFRIEFSSVKVIEINKQKLHPDIMLKFNKISKQWKTADENQHEALITDEELQIHKKRTYRQLLTRQLLIQHSHDASLVVVTLPVPREGISSCLYMTWLELITSNLPPCLLVRGNQTSVLTFYS